MPSVSQPTRTRREQVSRRWLRSTVERPRATGRRRPTRTVGRADVPGAPMCPTPLRPVTAASSTGSHGRDPSRSSTSEDRERAPNEAALRRPPPLRRRAGGRPQAGRPGSGRRSPAGSGPTSAAPPPAPACGLAPDRREPRRGAGAVRPVTAPRRPGRRRDAHHGCGADVPHGRPPRRDQAPEPRAARPPPALARTCSAAASPVSAPASPDPPAPPHIASAGGRDLYSRRTRPPPRPRPCCTFPPCPPSDRSACPEGWCGTLGCAGASPDADTQSVGSTSSLLVSSSPAAGSG